MTKIITSPAERVQKTISEAYKSATGNDLLQPETIQYINQQGEAKTRIKNNFYSNLLGLGGRSKYNDEYNQKLKELTNNQDYKDKSALELQDFACTLFLQGTYECGTPYDRSKQRVKSLLKGFDILDTKDHVKILAMRHGHKEGNDLTQLGIQEAQQAGKEFDFGAQDMVIGTHQTVIESVLISLIGGSQGLSPQQARDALPLAWQSPYKTAQVTEFLFSKNNDGEKILKISTNDHTETLTEQQCRNAYDNISQRPL